MLGGFSSGSFKQAASSGPKLPQLILRWQGLALARQNQWVLVVSPVTSFPLHLSNFSSLVLTGLGTSEQLSPVLQIGQLKQRETNLQRDGHSCSLAPTASRNGGSSPGTHCELL